ncbi:MAG TPA: HlyD family efflux transporter periplasmic adaptor subunit [Verrucomicrobiae bacterium]|nr:HlyD family efflux transporter periplasmic adaptor subunit [Verrucomicrobiae bacterium]
MAAALLSGGMLYARAIFTTATSDQAYINAEITALRAPIDGQLFLEASGSGRMLSAGAALFRIKNPRFGNQAAVSQLNWVKELAERLRVEGDEAAIRFQTQKEIYELHQKLFAEKLISRLAFLEEQTRLALAGSALTNKQAQAAQAEERCREMEGQVALQKEAAVAMPFDGIVWSVPARNGAQVSVHEAVLEVVDPKRVWVDAFFHERHAEKFAVGTPVNVRTIDRNAVWCGTVESVRGGVGRIPYDGVTAVSPGDYTRRRIAVRVRMNSDSPFDASRFLGVGRSVVVTLGGHE